MMMGWISKAHSSSSSSFSINPFVALSHSPFLLIRMTVQRLSLIIYLPSSFSLHTPVLIADSSRGEGLEWRLLAFLC